MVSDVAKSVGKPYHPAPPASYSRCRFKRHQGKGAFERIYVLSNHDNNLHPIVIVSRRGMTAASSRERFYLLLRFT